MLAFEWCGPIAVGAPGFTLFEYLKPDEDEAAVKIPEEIARAYARQLVLALITMHKGSFCHRDLKPENVFFDEAGNLKLGDLGFVNMFVDAEGLRELYTICGSGLFMAPELRYSAGPFEGSSLDVWSLGVLIFLMMRAMHPYWAVAGPEAGAYNALLDGRYEDFFFAFHAPFGEFDNPVFMDFIAGILRPNPMDRPNVVQIASHPWMAGETADERLIATEYRRRLEICVAAAARKYGSKRAGGLDADSGAGADAPALDGDAFDPFSFSDTVRSVTLAATGRGGDFSVVGDDVLRAQVPPRFLACTHRFFLTGDLPEALAHVLDTASRLGLATHSVPARATGTGVSSSSPSSLASPSSPSSPSPPRSSAEMQVTVRQPATEFHPGVEFDLFLFELRGGVADAASAEAAAGRVHDGVGVVALPLAGDRSDMGRVFAALKLATVEPAEFEKAQEHIRSTAPARPPVVASVDDDFFSGLGASRGTRAVSASPDPSVPLGSWARVPVETAPAWLAKAQSSAGTAAVSDSR